jgi:hypothetical protein
MKVLWRIEMKKTLLFVLIILVSVAGCAVTRPGKSPESDLRVMAEKERVIETSNKLFLCTDNRDWKCVKDLFASEVLFDMTSIGGGHPTKLTPQQIVDGWEQGLEGLKAVHHQAGNHLVAIMGNEAELFCYGIALHYLPNPTNRNTRTFVGSYDFHLLRTHGAWKIDRFKFNLKFIDGNKDLEAAARK